MSEFPRIEIVHHDPVDEGRFIAKKIIDGAVESEEMAEGQQRSARASDTGTFACLVKPCGPYEFRCSTIVDTPSGPVVATGYTRAQAKRRMHRAYLNNLEARKVGKDREERLLLAARAKFYCADLD